VSAGDLAYALAAAQKRTREGAAAAALALSGLAARGPGGGGGGYGGGTAPPALVVRPPDGYGYGAEWTLHAAVAPPPPPGASPIRGVAEMWPGVWSQHVASSSSSSIGVGGVGAWTTCAPAEAWWSGGPLAARAQPISAPAAVPASSPTLRPALPPPPPGWVSF
jgi:hypothetical protein